MTTETVKAPQKPRHRRFWERWIVDPVMKQLTQGVTPQKISLTLAVGSSMALFPILGTTTTLCVIAGVALRVNQAIIQGVNALCTIIYFPVMIALVRTGDWIAGGPRSVLNIPLMISQATHHPEDFLKQFGITAVHAVIGWAVVAPFWIPLVYYVMLPPLRGAARSISRR